MKSSTDITIEFGPKHRIKVFDSGTVHITGPVGGVCETLFFSSVDEILHGLTQAKVALEAMKAAFEEAQGK